MNLDRAVEISVHAFAAGKSLHHPYLVDRFEDVWIMQDAPRKIMRKSEAMAVGISPEQAADQVRRSGLGWHFLCHIHADEAEFASIRQQYKSLGYRALSTEWIFSHDLANIPDFRSIPAPRLVDSPEILATIRQRASQKRGLRPDARVYSTWSEKGDIGWVTSVPFGEDAWVSDLFVHRDCRRQGYATALMSRMLQDDVAHGIKTSVLIASREGSMLYPRIGYQKIGVLQVFCPIER